MNKDDKYTGFLAVPGMVVLAMGTVLFGWFFIGSLVRNLPVIYIIICGLFVLYGTWSLWVCWKSRIEIDSKGVRYIAPKKKGDIRWEDMKCVGTFRTPFGKDKLMFFSTIDEVWATTNMMENYLPLDKLIKVLPNRKIERIVAKYYPGEIIKLSNK